MREHIEHILAAFGALALALFISYFNTGTNAVTVSTVAPGATLIPVPETSTTFTPKFEPLLIIPTSTVELLTPQVRATTTHTVARTKKPAVVPKTPATKAQEKVVPFATSTPEVVIPPHAEPTPLQTLSLSVVNILCTSHSSTLRGISGSGVIIDSRGIILTVAHVAQAELLEETLGSGVMSCVIRTGNPAHTAYKAKVIYFPQTWLEKNSTTLISSHPIGSGENDFALLAITGTATTKLLPSSFSAVPLTSTTAQPGDEVSVGSYGAQYLTSTEVRNSLAPTLVTGTVVKQYSFDGSDADALSVLAGAAAQEGSSGGAVVNSSGYLIGLITASEQSGEQASRHLISITPSYLRRMYLEATGKSFDTSFDDNSPAALASSYTSTAMELGNYLAKAIGLK